MTTATVACPSGRQAEFVGSVYGGAVVMVTEHGQTFVADPGRFGEFGPEWVRRFFSEEGVLT